MTNCAARMEGARIIASLILSGWVVVLLVMGATSGVFLPAMAVFAIGVWRDWPWGWLGAVLMAGYWPTLASGFCWAAMGHDNRFEPFGAAALELGFTIGIPYDDLPEVLRRLGISPPEAPG